MTINFYLTLNANPHYLGGRSTIGSDGPPIPDGGGDVGPGAWVLFGGATVGVAVGKGSSSSSSR